MFGKDMAKMNKSSGEKQENFSWQRKIKEFVHYMLSSEEARSCVLQPSSLLLSLWDSQLSSKNILVDSVIISVWERKSRGGEVHYNLQALCIKESEAVVMEEGLYSMMSEQKECSRRRF